jgi:hypothetical protein
MGDIGDIPVFLAAGHFPSRVASIEDLEQAQGVVHVGELRSDATKNGRLEFETPSLQPGRYELVAYCPACAASSAGRNVLFLAPFRIVGGGQLQTGPTSRALLFVGAGASFLSSWRSHGFGNARVPAGTPPNASPRRLSRMELSALVLSPFKNGPHGV